jgi:plastocyanin
MKMTRIGIVLSAVALLGAACGGDGEDGGNGGGGEPVASDTLTMVDNEFEPADILVSADSTLTVTNDGEASHTFTLEEGSIDETVEAGGSTDVDITLAAGDYPYQCTFHPGMDGTLTVE